LLNADSRPDEPFSKRFSSVNLKADRKFQPQAYSGIPRIEISDQRRDWPNWDVLKLDLLIGTLDLLGNGDS